MVPRLALLTIAYTTSLLFSHVLGQEPDQLGVRPLETILQPDGTIKENNAISGSFDPTGWRMVLTDEGAPKFVPDKSNESEISGLRDASLSPGDEYWNGNLGRANPNGPVRVVLVSGNDIYVGGIFTLIGNLATNNIAKWNGSSWSSLSTGVSGGPSEVRSLAVFQDRIYVGGIFTTAGTVAANNIACWTASGGWAALGSGADDAVYAIGIANTYQSNHFLYVGGLFHQAGGVSADYVAQCYVSSSPPVWSPLGGGVNNPVRAIAVRINPDPFIDDVYIGGDFGFVFHSYGGEAFYVGSIARWTGHWEALGTGTVGLGHRVRALTVVGSNLYAGGDFTLAGGESANYIARWDGTNWYSLPEGGGAGNGTSGPVHSLSTSGSDIYAGGLTHISKWNGTWTSVSGVSGTVYAIGIDASGKVHPGGDFSVSDTENLATWNGTTLLPFGNMFRGIAQAVVVNGSDVFVGGVCYFTGTGDPANNIARWDGANWSSLPPGGGTNNGTNGPIHALAMGPNNYLYVGGTFTTAGGGSANRIAKYNLTTSAWSSLPSGGGFNNGVIGGISPRVNAIAAIGNDIYVGGSFTTAGLGSANNVARFDESINIWSSLPFGGGANNGVNSSVYAIMTNGPNQIYFGGFFSTAGGGSAKSVAKWNVGGATWSSLPSGGGANNGTNGNVRTIAISGTGVHVGGFFSTAGGSSANNIALWNGATWTSLPVGGGSNNGTTEIVRSMAFGGPHLYVGGDFTSAGGKTAYRVARWNGCDWFPMGSGANLFVLSVAANATPGSYGTNVFIGGEFSTTGGKTAENFGHWNPAFYDDPNCGQRAENSTTAHLGVAPIPEKLRLYQNHPNPFNPSTTIRYDLPEDGNVSLKIYDMLGREVMSVVDGFETAGYHQTTVDGTNLASGVYFYRLTAGSFSDMKRLLLLK